MLSDPEKTTVSMISLVMQHLTEAQAEPAASAALISTARDMGDIFGDIFGDLFGGGRRSRRAANNGPMKGANLRASVRITFEEAVFGCEKELELNLKDECTTCHGTGAKPGTTPETCPKCNGKGQVVYTQQSLVRAWCRMYRPVRTAAVPVRSSKRSVRTVVERDILSSRKKIAGNDPGRYRQRSEHPDPRKRRAGRERRSERRSSGGSDRISSHPIFQRQDMNIYLHSTHFLCTGSAGR